MIARGDFVLAAVVALAVHGAFLGAFLGVARDPGAQLGDRGDGAGTGVSIVSMQASALVAAAVANWTAAPQITSAARPLEDPAPTVDAPKWLTAPDPSPRPAPVAAAQIETPPLALPALPPTPALETAPDILAQEVHPRTVERPRQRADRLRRQRPEPQRVAAVKPAPETPTRREPTPKEDARRETEQGADAETGSAGAQQAAKGVDERSAQATGGAGGAAAGAAARDALRAWGAEINRAVARKKRYPDRSRRRGEEGVAPLRLTVASNGALVGAQLLRSSGRPRLDKAALAAAHAAAPFAPAPQGTGAGPHRFTLKVVFKMN